MKIALVTANYEEDQPVVEKYLVKEYAEQGHEVFLYVSKYNVPRFGNKKKINNESSIKGVHIRRLKSCGIRNKGLIFLFGLKKAIEKDNIEVIHAQEWFMPMIWQIRKNAKKMVVTQRIEELPFALRVLFKLYGKRLLNKAKAVTTLTNKTKERLINMGVKKEITVIPNGVDTELFKPINVEKNNKFTILSIGRLSIEKGINFLIRACKDIDFDYELKIIGSGKEEKSLKELATDLGINANFLGQKKQSALARYYSEADVFVVPSLKEPFGMTTAESMACGTPVIGSDVGGMSDVINDKVGLKVSAGEVAELTYALKMIKNRVNELKKNCREYVVKNYSWINIADKYLEVYLKR